MENFISGEKTFREHANAWTKPPEINMYFPFYKSGVTKEGNNEARAFQNFPQPTNHTNVRNETPLEAPSPKKQKLENEFFELAQHKFLGRSENRKSPLPYIGMIAEAINSSPDKKMVLSEIYAHMERNFFQYLSGKPRWRNTVRHNLSFHNCFVKCECSRRGNRSHFWSIHPEYIEQFKRGNFTKTLSPPRDQTNTSPRTLEQQFFRRNSYENYHRFLPNLRYGNCFHYDNNASLSTFYQAAPPPSNVIFPHHEVRSFPMIESRSPRGNMIIHFISFFWKVQHRNTSQHELQMSPQICKCCLVCSFAFTTVQEQVTLLLMQLLPH